MGPEMAGDVLRRRRRELGHELREIAQDLCIREHYLAAIEAGRTEQLPGAAYAVGFVRAYADALGLDGMALADRFRREALNGGGDPDLSFPSPLSEGGIPKGAMILVGTVIVSIVYGVWYLGGATGTNLVRLVDPPPAGIAGPALPKAGEQPPAVVVHRPGPDAIPGVAPARVAPAGDTSRQAKPAPPDAATEAAVATRTASGTTAAPAGNPAAGGPNAGAEPTDATAPGPREAVAGAMDGARLRAETGPPSARVVLRAKADCWIEVKDETAGKLIFARLLRAGERYDVPDRPGLKLLAGNAGGLELVVDAVQLPPLGRDGAVVRNIALEPDRLRGGAAPVRREG